MACLNNPVSIPICITLKFNVFSGSGSTTVACNSCTASTIFDPATGDLTITQPAVAHFTIDVNDDLSTAVVFVGLS
ncbi:hypothetical protein ACIGHG_01850 [Bacillus sp. NPDC077411]|uniref:Uncharacterized protein n=1 Tax=Bacillus bruguierae TaxID=3127667 RepID=A0ABU8FHR8_9BACI|nr:MULTISPECIES: hypothetical protein [unclassified Bacillus (in: firmicutes)]SFI89032.1 hypothetical protein SAMN04488574_10521 [Bacillus sp. 71mf]SFS66910.1 hypothetical protein SAMN04488145_102297 [Bacillus sp. 103mf]